MSLKICDKKIEENVCLSEQSDYNLSHIDSTYKQLRKNTFLQGTKDVINNNPIDDKICYKNMLIKKGRLLSNFRERFLSNLLLLITFGSFRKRGFAGRILLVVSLV